MNICKIIKFNEWISSLREKSIRKNTLELLGRTMTEKSIIKALHPSIVFDEKHVKPKYLIRPLSTDIPLQLWLNGLYVSDFQFKDNII